MQPVHISLDSALTDLTATGGTYDPAATWLVIFSAITNNGPDTVLADCTPATIASYPRQVLTSWGSVYHLVDGSAVRDAPAKVFVPPDDSHPTVIVGYGLVDSATVGNLLAFTVLDTPISLNLTTDHYTIVVRAVMPALGELFLEEAWNG
jgi:hypothetical protein